jgi:hypothetical protein
MRESFYYNRVAGKGEIYPLSSLLKFLSPFKSSQHVLFAHCEPPRRNDFSASVQLLPCAWAACKYKRFNAAHLKEHVLEHLRPLAFVCPFQECRMSINSHMDSIAALDAVSRRKQCLLVVSLMSTSNSTSRLTMRMSRPFVLSVRRNHSNHSSQSIHFLLCQRRSLNGSPTTSE